VYVEGSRAAAFRTINTSSSSGRRGRVVHKRDVLGKRDDVAPCLVLTAFADPHEKTR
jgi:hypothetical protein